MTAPAVPCDGPSLRPGPEEAVAAIVTELREEHTGQAPGEDGDPAARELVRPPIVTGV